MITRLAEALGLFERVLERPPDERERFLAMQASGDPDLHERVAAMLRADSQAHPLLDAGPESLARLLSDAATVDVAGLRVGPYVLVRQIGRGGMATVYLANDEKHGRSVALKLLHADAASALGGERFRREIEVVARLQHPHILPLYDSGEAGDARDGAGGRGGLLYYVMPLVSGETLRERIAREGPLKLEDVRRIVTDVSAALDYAHRNGVVHRDVKPANILVDAEHAMVADFGIAHQALDGSADQLTATGIVIGTPQYMSPEQSTGSRDIDARTDIYALGCVLFEMLTGMPPYQGATVPNVVAKHLHAPIPSAHALRADLPEAIDDVLARALAKEPAERFPSAREFSAAVAAALDSSGSASAPSIPAATPRSATPARSRSRMRIALGGAVVVTVAGAVALAATSTRFSSIFESAPPSIAVLPFANMSDSRENEYFSDGITEELTGALAGLGRFHVTPRTTAFAYKGRTGDIKRIGRELGVGHILEGSVRRDGDALRISATLYDVGSGERLLNETYDRAFGSVLTLQADIAATIAERLAQRLLPADRARLAERHTVAADAYDSYLKGRYFFDQRTAASLSQAITHFQRAIEIDSLYARAHAGLAATYSILAWTGFAAPSDLFRRAERAANRALQLDSTLAEAHISLAIIAEFGDWNWAAAERATARAIALDSTLAAAWFWRTWHFISAGKPAEAMAALQRARTLEPLSLITNARIATLLVWDDRLRDADSVLRRTLEIDASYPVARVQRARVLSLLGRHDEAIAALPPDSVRLGSYESGIAGFVYARAGRREEALAAARALESRSYVPAEGVAAIYAGLGDREAALTWLERAVSSRGVGLVFLAAEPMYDVLHDDPRYRRVVEQIGIVQ